MDACHSAQDVHRCGLCKTALAQSYCDFCDVSLCKPCIGEHISDGYHKHIIVPLQERRSTLIYPKCGIHPHKHCKYQCTDCKNIFVCSSCMTSETHERHKFVDLTNYYKIKMENIGKDREGLENLNFSKYEELALGLEDQLANMDEEYKKITTEVTNQSKEWHRNIDIVTNKIKTEINEIKVKHKDILQKQLDEIKQIQSLFKQTILALKEIENSNEVAPTIEYNSKIRDFSKLPPKVQVTLPTFIPKPIDCEKIYSTFGEITPLHVSSASEKTNFLPKNTNNSVRELLDELELVALIQTGYDFLKYVACLNKEQIWTCGESGLGIKCFNINGLILQTIKTKPKEFLTGLAVDSDGNLLYCCSYTRTVLKVKNGQTEILIKWNAWGPIGLCCTTTGDFLVSMKKCGETQFKVVRYSGSTEKQTIQNDDKGNPLYSGDSIKYLTENRNHDICVADFGAAAVVVVSQEGKLRWRYTGHPSVTKNKPFKPWGITTDSQSRILTADRDNHCIHILDQNGQFLRYIDICGLTYPEGVCVDTNDNLFVCCSGKCNLKKIKYSK